MTCMLYFPLMSPILWTSWGWRPTPYPRSLGHNWCSVKYFQGRTPGRWLEIREPKSKNRYRRKTETRVSLNNLMSTWTRCQVLGIQWWPSRLGSLRGHHYRVRGYGSGCKSTKENVLPWASARKKTKDRKPQHLQDSGCPAAQRHE